MGNYTLHSRNDEAEKPIKKMGVVTGARDRSELESMIQRYLELAHSALKNESELGAENQLG